MGDEESSFYEISAKADRVLEHRMVQLKKRGKITFCGDIGQLIENRHKVNDESLSPTERMCYCMNILMTHGIEETIASSDDWLVKRLYERCKFLDGAYELEGRWAMNECLRGIEEEEKRQHAELEGRPIF